MKKTVHVVQRGSRGGVFQAMYLDRAANWLYPDVALMDDAGTTLFQTNALRLRGPDVQAEARIGVVWGDSVVFGAEYTSWPERMNELSDDCIFLNGGIEGIEYATVFRRAIEFNRKHKVAVNVVVPGWHRDNNKNFESDLRMFVEELPNAVLTTMPTSLNEDLWNVDISRQIIGFGAIAWDSIDTGFGFWGTEPYSVPRQNWLWAHICERNAMIRGVAHSTGTPVIDLFAAFYTRGLEDFRRDFFDVPHPRPSAYPAFAKTVYDAVTQVVNKAA